MATTTSDNPLNDPEHIIIVPSQLALLGITYGPSQIRRMWKAGEFPAPVQLSPHRIGFRLSEVKAWVASRQPVATAPDPKRRSRR